MKTFLILPFAFLIFNSAAQPITILSTNLDRTGSTNDTIINVKAVNNPIIWQGRVYRLPVNGTNFTTVNGVGTMALVPGKYVGAYAGVPQSFTFDVTNSAITLNLADIIETGRGIVFHSGVTAITGSGGIVTSIDGNGVVNVDGSGIVGSGTNSGSGDVTGPGSSQQHHVTSFANTTGKALEDSGVPISDVARVSTLGSMAFASTSGFDPINAWQLSTNGTFLTAWARYPTNAFANTNSPIIHTPSMDSPTFNGPMIIPATGGNFAIKTNIGSGGHDLGIYGPSAGLMMDIDDADGTIVLPVELVVNNELDANSFVGSGVGLTSIPASQLTGLVPAANIASGPANSTTFARGDGQWATPNGSGNVNGPGTSVAGNFASFNGSSGTVIQDSGTAFASFDLAGSAAAVVPTPWKFITNADLSLTISNTTFHTVMFTANTNGSLNFLGNLFTNASGITTTNTFYVGWGSAGGAIAATNQFQVDTRKGAGAFTVGTNGNGVFKNNATVSGNFTNAGNGVFTTHLYFNDASGIGGTAFLYQDVLGNNFFGDIGANFSTVKLELDSAGNLVVTNNSGPIVLISDVSGNSTFVKTNGSGSQLTALNASQLNSGTIPSGVLPFNLTISGALSANSALFTNGLQVAGSGVSTVITSNSVTATNGNFLNLNATNLNILGTLSVGTFQLPFGGDSMFYASAGASNATQWIPYSAVVSNNWQQIFTTKGINSSAGFTDSVWTASTDLEVDANKQAVSLANGSGVKTNNGSGSVGWSIKPIIDVSAATNATTIQFNGSTNITLNFDGWNHTMIVTNAPTLYVNFSGGPGGTWTLRCTNNNIHMPYQLNYYLGASNNVVTNGTINLQSVAGTNDIWCAFGEKQ